MITVGENTRVAPEEARNYHVSVSIAVANLDNRRRPGHSTVVMSGGQMDITPQLCSTLQIEG